MNRFPNRLPVVSSRRRSRSDRPEDFLELNEPAADPLHHLGVSASGPGFEEFYVLHSARFAKVAFAIVRDRHAAEDVVQSAFAKAFVAWWRVSRADDPGAYVRRIVVNEALALLRRPSTRFENSHSGSLEPEGHGNDPSTPDDEIWHLLEQLPPRQRIVIVLRYYEGLTEREIAHVMGCRPGTVKSQASAAMTHLRTQLRVLSDQSEGS